MSGSAGERISETLITGGPVTVVARKGAATALAVGELLAHAVSGRGALAFYAPATSGLGAAGTWETYTASIAAPGVFGVGLAGADVLVNGQAFTGTLALVVAGPLTLSGRGATLAPDFAASAALTADDAFVRLAPSGDAFGGYNGAIAIAEQSAALDLATLDGTYARSLAVAANPAQSQITPFEPTSFQVDLSAVASTVPETLAVTVTVAPPAGWSADFGAAGCTAARFCVSTTPPRNAEPGDYPIAIVAQAVETQNFASETQYIASLLATTVHTVTILPHDGMQLAVAPDPLTTVPWPTSYSPPAWGELEGGAQIPGAAYLATISNTSTVAHTFRVEVAPDNFPADWIALGGVGTQDFASLRLAAGGDAVHLHRARGSHGCAGAGSKRPGGLHHAARGLQCPRR